MRKLYEFSKVLQFQKRIFAAATIWGNAVCFSLDLSIYRISSYSFLPWIVSSHSCTVIFGLMYCALFTKRNSFRGNYMRKYGIRDTGGVCSPIIWSKVWPLCWNIKFLSKGHSFPKFMQSVHPRRQMQLVSEQHWEHSKQSLFPRTNTELLP